jgi:hypothetical protein
MADIDEIRKAAREGAREGIRDAQSEDPSSWDPRETMASGYAQIEEERAAAKAAREGGDDE